MNNTNAGYSLRVVVGPRLQFCVADGSTATKTAEYSDLALITLDEWVLVVGVRDADSGTCQIGMNGKFLNERNDGTGTINNTKIVQIGQRYDETSPYTGQNLDG